MQPLLDEAAQIKATVVDLKEKLKRLKKDQASDAELLALTTQILEKEMCIRDREEAEAVGANFSPALRSPYRWQDWAAPPPKNESDKPGHPKTAEGKPFGWKRQELFAAGDGKLFEFINKELLPHLHLSLIHI